MSDGELMKHISRLSRASGLLRGIRMAQLTLLNSVAEGETSPSEASKKIGKVLAESTELIEEVLKDMNKGIQK